MKNKVLLIIFSIIFIIYTILVKLDILTNIDIYLYNIVTLNMNDTLTSICKILTNLGCTTFIVSLCIIMIIIFSLSKKKKYALIMSITIIISTILNNVVKLIITRGRPDINPLVIETTYSYPSGHSMASVTIYGILIYLINKLNIPKSIKVILSIILGIIPIIVIYTRIYLGAHYVSDTIGGIMLSCIVLIVCISYVEDKNII